MDSDQPPSEPSDDPKPPSNTTTEPPQQQTTTHTPRSYECAFCKRGFTNAQALGGHMNIHRKNKTKIKHSTTTTTPPIATVETTATVTAAQGNLLSVPVPLIDHHDLAAVQRNIHHFRSSAEGDVDLELRLGHVERPPESSSEHTTTTRKFF